MEKSGRWEGPGLARTVSVSLSLGAILREPNFWTSHSGVSVGCKACQGGIGWVPTDWERVGLYLCSHVSCRELSHQGEKYLSRAFLREEDNVTWGSWTFLSEQKERGPNRAWLPPPMKQTEDVGWGCLPNWS